MWDKTRSDLDLFLFQIAEERPFACFSCVYGDPGDKLTKWPAIRNILPVSRRWPKIILIGFCISQAHIQAFETTRSRPAGVESSRAGRARASLRFYRKGALREILTFRQISTIDDPFRLQEWREDAGVGSAIRNPFKLPSDFWFRTPHCHHRCRRYSDDFYIVLQDDKERKDLLHD